MKRQSLFTGILIVCVLFAACVTTEPQAVQTTDPSVVSLDTAIQSTTKNISDNLAAGIKIVVLNFNSPADQFTDYVIEEISLSLVNTKKFTIVDRRNLDLIREEIGFQMSGEVNDESAQEIGKVLGAQSIVSGSLINMGDSYRFRVKTINVGTAAIETSYSVNISDNSQIRYLLASGKSTPNPGTSRAGKGEASAPQVQAQAVPQARSEISIPFAALTPEFQAAVLAPPATQATAPAEPPAEKVYKIGDTGPAGGLIFYDKGRYSEGWRYLEAAPVGAEFLAEWRIRETGVENLQESIGSGKRNTQIIVDTFKKTAGEWDTAAQKCDELSYQGFDDWFLPCRGELDQIYGQLKRKGVGDFKNGIYWASDGWRQNFENGRFEATYSSHLNNKYYVRPVRAF
jgi:TolB-like protein